MAFLDTLINNGLDFRNNIDPKKFKNIVATARKLRLLSEYGLDKIEGIDYFEIFHQIESVEKFMTPKEVVQNSIIAGQILSVDYNFNELIDQNDKESGSIIIDESKKITKILQDIFRDNSKLLTLNCWEFEEIVAELLLKQGYKVELTQKTKDNGYDIIAIMKMKMATPLKFLVQCKHYTKHKVGVDIIRSFKEVIDTEKANRGIIVTTSYFTKGAIKKQSEIPYLLEYRDKDKVIEWVKDYFNQK